LALLKLCRCSKPIPINQSRCDQCVGKQANTNRHRLYDKYRRDKDAAKFYSSKAWQLVREQALTRDIGLCQHCLKSERITLAEMVDHIIPVKVAWEYRLTIENLQSLCNACHRKKTEADKREYKG
jgi:5-methylcytosine-specific restriction enzyme A